MTFQILLELNKLNPYIILKDFEKYNKITEKKVPKCLMC